ncbi:MAG: hypothetical protein LBG83_03610 [Oscillospiraceae bacterium]|jgi:RNA polymerase sigma factor (sigma-70 family)|nr:hypothetical protein [Oscillospiraceae bacterium]
MKYIYQNATGKTEIEVDEQFHDLLIAMDREEFNSDRKHSRRYPISLESCEYEGEWFGEKHNSIEESESAVQWEQASAALTDLQRICFVEVCLNGRTQQEVADQLGIAQQGVDRHIKAAKKKLQKIFQP